MIPDRAKISRRAGAVLLIGTIIGGWPASLLAQETQPQTQPSATPVPATTAPSEGMIRSIGVRGNQRLEPATIIAYSNLTPGQTYSADTLDQALKDLYATSLFSSVVISGGETGNIVITVQENPVINRIVLEGNKKLKEDKILPEIQLKTRQIFTAPKVRADVDRIIELYKRQGRFAARVEPKIVQLEQNRVDLVFEIYEGPVSKIRKINIIGNENFGDGRLIKEMYSREAGGVLGFLKSNDSYDPDRLAADQQKLRAFYLTQGYADFRVISALAELTPDRRDFIITYVVEEGPRYKFGTVDAESALRDLSKERIMRQVRMEQGDWFNAKAVEDTVTALNEVAGTLGYAFADINPTYNRNAEARTMDVVFHVGETPRQYIERIDVRGNTITHDKVVRREFRLNEGDPFNSVKIKRSQDRIKSLGYFQDELEVKQTEGSAPDRVVLGVDVEEKPTGQLQFSAGYSSLERLLFSLAVQQTNFRGMGQGLDAAVSWSRYSKSISAGFTEPYLFDKQILLGGQLYRRDYNSFNFIGGQRNTTYSQVSTGGSLRLGFPLNEYMSYGTRFAVVNDKVSLGEALYFTDPDGADGPEPPQCDPLKAGRYLCDELGSRLTVSFGHTFIYSDVNGIRPTRGQILTISQDFAGLAGGTVRYIRTRGDATKYKGLGGGWVLSGHIEGGYIHPLKKTNEPGRDPIRLTDRFFGNDMRGFDIRGIGPRVFRVPYNTQGILNEVDFNKTTTEGGIRLVSDSIGGHAYYQGRIELEVPTSSSLRSLGLRPSAFVDVGSVWGLTKPNLVDVPGTCKPSNSESTDPSIVLEPGQTAANCPATGYVFIPGYKEFFLGNSPKPRVAIGVGVNWVSPFGPLRLDIAKAIIKQAGDDTKFFSFNVGTQF